MLEASQKHFEESFSSGGFTDTGFKRWERLRSGAPSYLTDTGRLKKAWRKVIKIPGQFGEIVNTMFYSDFHNEGMGKNLQRKFMGESSILNKKLDLILKRYIK